MSIFTRPSSSASATPEASNLPTGHDDPESPMYIPEEYRDDYAAESGPVSTHDLMMAVDELARGKATAELIAEYTSRDRNGQPLDTRPLGETYRTLHSQRVETVKANQAEALFELAAHAIRRERAIAAKTNRDQRLEREHEHIVANTCPVCTECDPASNGKVTWRTFLDRHDAAGIRSCEACFGTALDEVRQARAEVIVDSRRALTRRDLVRVTLRETAEV